MQQNSRKFLPAKVSRYTVLIVSLCIGMELTLRSVCCAELGAHSRPKRVKTESERDGEEEVRKRETDRPSKARSLNDPETVRMNAKKALFQTLWRRSVKVVQF